MVVRGREGFQGRARRWLWVMGRGWDSHGSPLHFLCWGEVAFSWQS